MIFQILINHEVVYTGPFATWWDAHDSAINRGLLCEADHVQVKAV
ncbi:hypothetical protein P3W85_29775 [Cupriavidus basilensis]|uniref:Uncharacterized protein n=1 Tax=Cupriavidus basilensis TaxID=68895 RepID=A0ABT6AWX9_9BURK|nr:hypothetical protein [Cupriavidus basilensis]MDF3837112.1 hypothetical protein [Cupriavidus basilensis]